MITDRRSRSPIHWAALFAAAWRGGVEWLALWRVRRSQPPPARR